MAGAALAVVPLTGLLVALGLIVGGGVAAFFISITRDRSAPELMRRRAEEAAKQAAVRAANETIERIFRAPPD